MNFGVIKLSSESFLLLKITPYLYALVSNPDKTHWFIKLDFSDVSCVSCVVGSLSGVFRHLFMCPITQSSSYSNNRESETKQSKKGLAFH